MSVDELLRDHHALHSTLQMDAWILQQDNWTPWGRYQQALRELHGRRGTLEALRIASDTAMLDLEDLRRAKPWFGWLRPRAVRRWKLRIEALRIRLRDTLASLEEATREHQHFHRRAAELKAEIGEVTPEMRERLDRETWIVRIRQMAAVDLQCNGRVGPQIVKMIAALPVSLRRMAVEEVEAQKRIALQPS